MLSCFCIEISVFFFQRLCPPFVFNFLCPFPFASIAPIRSRTCTRSHLLRPLSACTRSHSLARPRPSSIHPNGSSNSQPAAQPFAMDSKSQVGPRHRARTHCSDAGKRTREDEMRTAHVSCHVRALASAHPLPVSPLPIHCAAAVSRRTVAAAATARLCQRSQLGSASPTSSWRRLRKHSICSIRITAVRSISENSRRPVRTQNQRTAGRRTTLRCNWHPTGVHALCICFDA